MSPKLSLFSTILIDAILINHRSFRLHVVQQPERAAEFGTNILSRIPLSPPPIVQLFIYDSATGATTAPCVYLSIICSRKRAH